MCTFKDEQTVQVCDVAMSHVRDRLHEVFGETVCDTTVQGQGTLAQVPSTADARQFQSVTRAAIAEAQNTMPQPRSHQEKGGQQV